MADLQQMSRVLYHHDWTNVEDWARNVDQLADLSDEEIGQLQQCDGDPRRSSVDSTLVDATLIVSARDVQPPLIERARQSLLGFCDTLRFGLRRPC